MILYYIILYLNPLISNPFVILYDPHDPGPTGPSKFPHNPSPHPRRPRDSNPWPCASQSDLLTARLPRTASGEVAIKAAFRPMTEEKVLHLPIWDCLWTFSRPKYIYIYIYIFQVRVGEGVGEIRRRKEEGGGLGRSEGEGLGTSEGDKVWGR